MGISLGVGESRAWKLKAENPKACEGLVLPARVKGEQLFPAAGGKQTLSRPSLELLVCSDLLGGFDEGGAAHHHGLSTSVRFQQRNTTEWCEKRSTAAGPSDWPRAEDS